MQTTPKPLSFALEVFSVGTGTRIYDIHFDSVDATTACSHGEMFMRSVFQNKSQWSAALQRRRLIKDGETRMQVKTWNL